VTRDQVGQVGQVGQVRQVGTCSLEASLVLSLSNDEPFCAWFDTPVLSELTTSEMSELFSRLPALPALPVRPALLASPARENRQ